MRLVGQPQALVVPGSCERGACRVAVSEWFQRRDGIRVLPGDVLTVPGATPDQALGIAIRRFAQHPTDSSGGQW